MIEFERKVGPKGQIVIPKEIRRSMGIKPKTRVLVTLEKENVVIKHPKEDIADNFKKTAESIGHKGRIDIDKLYESEFRKR